MCSEKYESAISNAQAWFASRLGALPEVSMQQAVMKARGTDAIDRADIRALLSEGMQHMLVEHNYELSYSQLCRAFFGAAQGLNRLHLS